MPTLESILIKYAETEPLDRLDNLIDNTYPKVREKVASRCVGLEILITDPNPMVRAMVAQRCPQEMLPQLLNDLDPWVKYNAIKRASIDQLQEIRNSTNSLWRNLARKRIKYLVFINQPPD